jgi:hypothetical protein
MRSLSPLMIIKSLIMALRQLVPSIELPKGVIWHQLESSFTKVELTAYHPSIESIKLSDLIWTFFLVLQIQSSVPVG